MFDSLLTVIVYYTDRIFLHSLVFFRVRLEHVVFIPEINLATSRCLSSAWHLLSEVPWWDESRYLSHSIIQKFEDRYYSFQYNVKNLYQRNVKDYLIFQWSFYRMVQYLIVSIYNKNVFFWNIILDTECNNHELVKQLLS